MGILSDSWADDAPAVLVLPPASVTDVVAEQQEAQAQAASSVWTPRDFPLLDFVREAWPIVEKGRRYDHNWHLETLCTHFEACYTGDITHLLVNCPPRSGKSIILSVMLHPWSWILNPAMRWLFVSYSMTLSLRDARRARELIRSPWYQRQWGDRVQIDPAFDTIAHLRTTAGGARFSSTVGGVATGMGGDILVVDDPHSADEDRRESRADIEAAKDFILNTLASRVENFNESRQILCGQRIAVDDISAQVLADKTHESLIIPMRYLPPPDDQPPPITSLGWTDPRTVPGELMWPAHMNERAAATMERTKQRIWAAHFQQAPEDATDKLFPKTNWRRFDLWPPVDFFSVLIQSWDMRFTDDPTVGSYVAGHIWGKHGPDLYLLARVFERLSFPETQDAVRHLSTLEPYGPHTTAKLVENKANGPAIMQSLRATIAGFIPVEPRYYGGKYDRAQAMAFLQHSGNVWVPSAALAPWSDAYIDNMFKFPAPPDDDTDASSQAWRRLHPLQPATDERQEEKQRTDALQRKKLRALKGQQGLLRLSRTNA